MLQDFRELYSAYAEDRTANLPAPIPFSVYAKEEIAFSSSEEYEATVKCGMTFIKTRYPL
jgi:hypothetical protein